MRISRPGKNWGHLVCGIPCEQCGAVLDVVATDLFISTWNYVADLDYPRTTLNDVDFTNRQFYHYNIVCPECYNVQDVTHQFNAVVTVKANQTIVQAR